MEINATHITNPFQVRDKLKYCQFSSGTTISTIAKHFHNSNEFKRATICFLNNNPVLRSRWNESLQGTNSVLFLTIPQNGEDGSDPVKTVLMIALLVYAPGLGATLFPGVAAGTATGLVMFAGSMIINALIPPPKPPTTKELGTPSPTYSLQAQGNVSRLLEPIPIIYGKHIIFPDFAAPPYFEYENNTQYLYQELVIGNGSYVIDQDSIRLGDTKVSSYGSNVIVQIINPGQKGTLVKNLRHLQDVSGDAVLNDDDIFHILTPVGQTTSYVDIDIGLLQGLYDLQSDNTLASASIAIRVRAYSIDDNDVRDYTRSYTVLEVSITSVAIESNRINPILRTFKNIPIPSGRFGLDLDIEFPGGHDFHAGLSDKVTLLGIKTHITSDRDYGDVTTAQMKIKVGKSITQQKTRKFNLVAQKKIKIPVANVAWDITPMHTSNSIAWILVDIVTSKNYGGNMDISKLDIDHLKELDRLWSNNGDSFNGVFDRKISIWEAITLVARCGRAMPISRAGILTFIRDQQQSIPAGMFTMNNIVKDSLSINYVLPSDNVADRLELEYIDDQTWKPTSVKLALDNAKNPIAASIKLFGCTNKAQANREGWYLLQSNNFRRKSITFDTELEGLIPTYGSTITIAHDIPSWGQSGFITDVQFISIEDSLADNALQLSTSCDINFSGNGTDLMALRKRDGTIIGPFTPIQGENGTIIVYLSHIPISASDSGIVDTGIDFETNREPTHFVFGNATFFSIKAKVKSIKPKGNFKIQITAVEDDDSVYSPFPVPVIPNSITRTLNISINSVSVDVFKLLGNPTQIVFLTINIEPWVTIWSVAISVTSSFSAALTVQGFKEGSTTTINNSGTIVGQGGTGGSPGVAGGYYANFAQATPGSDGGDGGSAIECWTPLTLNNMTTGRILAGGGGGGGGAYYVNLENTKIQAFHGNSGSGGAGFRLGGISPNPITTDDPGNWNRDRYELDPSYPGSATNLDSYNYPTATSEYAAGPKGHEVRSSGILGNGGAGGELGKDGQAANSGEPAAGGAGGKAGKAIYYKSTYTLKTNTGSIIGRITNEV